MRDEGKIILHIDVDAFFASVEQLLLPALRDRPVIVGSGCIASCSYEARSRGLRAGMPLRQAMRLCPSAVRVPGRYPIYRCFAEQIWQLCHRYVTGLETYLDEAYGDATQTHHLYGGPKALGQRLQRHVRDEVHLPVTIGLGANRMLAKVASHHGKPGGVVWIPPGGGESFLAPLPVERLPGVGHKTAQMLHDMNIATVEDLRGLSRASLRGLFGRRGELLYERCRGRDDRAARPAAAPKTISRETTFHSPTHDPAEICGMLQYLLERAMRAMRRIGLLTRTVELTIRYDDWKQRNVSRTLSEPTAADDDVLEVVLELLRRLHNRRVALRHVGIVLSRFRPAGSHTTLFEPDRRTKARRIYRAIDAIRGRWGHAAVVTGKSLELLGKLEQNDYGFILRTPSLTK